MAEFCSQCEPEGDYDLMQIALDLDLGHSVNILCEGCNTRGIYKDESSNLYLAKQEEEGIELVVVNIDEL